jgi:hypothetical protein
MKFLPQTKLKNRHETILVAGMKFGSEAMLKIRHEPFWLLEWSSYLKKS